MHTHNRQPYLREVRVSPFTREGRKVTKSRQNRGTLCNRPRACVYANIPTSSCIRFFAAVWVHQKHKETTALRVKMRTTGKTARVSKCNAAGEMTSRKGHRKTCHGTRLQASFVDSRVTGARNAIVFSFLSTADPHHPGLGCGQAFLADTGRVLA